MFADSKNKSEKYLIALLTILLCSVMFSGCKSDAGNKSEAEIAAVTEPTIIATENNTESSNTDVIIAEGNDSFYKQRLDEFNRKYDTKFVLPDDDKEAMEWITSLSPEAFDDFLMALYDGSAYDVEQPRIRNNDIFMGEICEEIESTQLPENAEKEL